MRAYDGNPTNRPPIATHGDNRAAFRTAHCLVFAYVCCMYMLVLVFKCVYVSVVLWLRPATCSTTTPQSANTNSFHLALARKHNTSYSFATIATLYTLYINIRQESHAHSRAGDFTRRTQFSVYLHYIREYLFAYKCCALLSVYMDIQKCPARARLTSRETESWKTHD